MLPLIDKGIFAPCQLRVIFQDTNPVLNVGNLSCFFLFLYYVPEPQTLTRLTPASQAGAPRLALSLSNQVKSNALASLGQTLLASLVLDFLPHLNSRIHLRLRRICRLPSEDF